MKLLVKRAVALAITYFSVISEGKAQYNWKDLEYGLNFGFTVYQGDLSNGRFGSLRAQRPYLGFSVTKLIGDFFSTGLNFSMGKLQGDDSKFEKPEYKKHRNFNFSSPIYELTARMNWNFSGKNHSFKGIAPYVFAGGGVSFLNIKRDWSRLDRDYFLANADVLTKLSADSAISPPKNIVVFPIGGGIKYFMSHKWVLNLEAGYRFTTTDYLDGFSRSVNPIYKDSYILYSVGISYRPGKDPLSCAFPKY